MLSKLRNRSFDELKTRGLQSLTAFAEQNGIGGGVPSDREFWSYFDRSVFRGLSPSKGRLLDNFRLENTGFFFPSFDAKIILPEFFPANFGQPAADRVIKAAERATRGRFDLLGYKDLNVGTTINWLLEPVSGKVAPQQHWRKFDELNAGEIGDFKIIWELNRQQHFFWLGAAYKLTGDERFAQTFVLQLSGWMQQNPPKQTINWMSSLEIALRSISWLWGLYFFKNSSSLTPEIFADALRYLHLNARHIETYLSTYYSPNTHLTGEALALYYLGTLLPQFRRSREWHALGKRILFAELDRQIWTDGTYWEQTTWYAHYTIDFYLHFAILSRLNRENVSDAARDKLEGKLQAGLDFLMYLQRPNRTLPRIGDDDGGFLMRYESAHDQQLANTFAVAAAFFKRGDYKFAAGNQPTPAVFWLLGANGVETFNKLKPHPPARLSKFFANGGYLAVRDNWSETADMLLIDGGTHGALNSGHAHADALAVELTVGGRPTLVDAGTFSYHESLETRNYFRRTLAHNTLTIDDLSSSEPSGKFSWASVADADTTTVLRHEKFSFFSGRHDGFARSTAAEDAARHTRSALFLPDNYSVLLDEVNIFGEHLHELRFHFASDCRPQIATDDEAQNFVLNPPLAEDKRDGLKIYTFGDNGAWQIEDDLISPFYGASEKSKTAVFGVRGNGRQEFFTFLLPTARAKEAVPVKEVSANGGRCFAINFGHYRDWLIFGDGDGTTVENELFSSNFRVAWARLDRSIFELTEVLLIGGSQFSFNEIELLRLDQNTEFAFAETVDGELVFAKTKQK